MWFKKKKLSILFLLVLLINAIGSPMVFAEEETVDKPSLIALGDSITFGWNLYEGETPDKTKPSNHAFPNYILGGGFEVTNLSWPGWTSSDLLNALKTEPRFSQGLAQADVITLNIGNNDFLGLPEIQDLRNNPRLLSEAEIMALKMKIGQAGTQLAANLQQIFQGIRTANQTAPIIFYNMYNPFEANTNPVLYNLGKSLIEGDGVNPGINELVYASFDSKENGIFLVDAYSTFEGNQATYVLPFPDVHPTVEGQRALAALADAVIYSLLPPEMEITLTATPTDSTEGPVNISVATNQEELLEIMWLPGQLEVKDFETAGNVVEINNQVFEVTENGFYTVYVLSGYGEEKVQTIEITNIVEPEEEPPGEEEPPAEEPPAEEPPANEEQPPVKEDPVKEEPTQTPEKQTPSKSGPKLPNTATSTYNYLFAGVSLLFLGTVFFVLYVRKRRVLNS